jgi:tetratricopeptide (TPR) repeat protein
MHLQRHALCVLASLVCLVLGCSSNPAAQKAKYLASADQYFAKEQYREAAIQYQNAIQVDPSSATAHYGLAKTLMKEKLWPDAYRELQRAAQLDPANIDAQLDLADLMIAGKQNASSIVAGVLQRDAHNARAEVLLANIDANAGLVTKAIAEAQAAVQMDPQRAASYVTLALLQLKAGDSATAEENLKKAASLNPKSSVAPIALAGLYETQKRWANAEAQNQAAIAAESSSPVLRAALARLYLEQGQPDKAEQTLRDAKAALPSDPEAYRMLGDFFLSRGLWEKAAAEFADLYRTHPKDLVVAHTYEQILIGQGHWDEAAQINDANLKASPSDIDSQILQGEILNGQGKATQAVDVLQSTVASAPNNPLAHYALGLALSNTGNDIRAQSEWRRAIELRPNMPDPQRALAALALRQRDEPLLLTSSEQLIKLEPGAAEGYIFHSEAMWAKGDTAAAEEDLRKAVSEAPEDPAGYARFGDLRVQQKRYDEAEKLYEQALALNSSATDALAGLVEIDVRRNQPEAAVQRVQQQIARAPGVSNFYMLLGQVEIRTQNFAQAEASLEKAIELNHANVPAELLLANLQVSHGSPDRAVETLRNAVNRNPGDLRLYGEMGSLLEGRGDWQQAEALYQKALQIDPHYGAAANNLAYLMLDHGGDLSVALTLAQTARRELPNLPNSADTLGWAYYHQGVYSAAIDMLKQATEGDPQNATYHYHLGMAYQKSKNLPLAKQQFESALRIDPNMGQAAAIRQALSAPN